MKQKEFLILFEPEKMSLSIKPVKLPEFYLTKPKPFVQIKKKNEDIQKS